MKDEMKRNRHAENKTLLCCNLESSSYNKYDDSTFTYMMRLQDTTTQSKLASTPRLRTSMRRRSPVVVYLMMRQRDGVEVSRAWCDGSDY